MLDPGKPSLICAAVVTAGGVGKRMGSGVPKQYLDLHGFPILARTLLVFDDHPLINRIVITVPPENEDFCRENVIIHTKGAKPIDVVAGGATRQESVFNGLKRLAETDIVAIHDGVRPLVTPDVVTRTIHAARHCGAALAAVRVKDTVKRQADGRLETIPRSNLWLAHTPQTFRSQLIIEAHRQAAAEGYQGTDDAALVERMGLPVALVEDSEDNIKITTQRDLDLARILFRLGPNSSEFAPPR